MGSKYISTTLIGYNSSAPSDDGTQVDSNKVEWQKHLDKIGDPLKTQVAAMDVAMAAFSDLAPTSKTSTYSTLTTDNLRTVECTGTFTVTLLTAATGGAGYTVAIKNIGTGTITLEGAGSELIDGEVNLTLAENDCVTVQVDAAVTGYTKISNYNATDEAKLADIAAGSTAAASGANSDITSLSGLTTDLSVPQGGTGAGTFTDGGVLIGNSTGAVQSTSAGTSGQALISNGPGVDPSFQSLAAAVIPAGTLMLFQQTAAPTGWTKETTHNDKALRVVSGTAGSGGTSAFTTVFGKTATDGHQLTITEMPAHTHDQQADTSLSTGGAVVGGNSSLRQQGGTTQSTGGDGSHSHNMDIRVQYVDLIICSKD